MDTRTLPQNVLDALTAHAAVVADDGEIIGVNVPWKRFADENGLGSGDYCLGESYHDACEDAAATDPVAAGVCDAIRGVCSSDLTRAEFEYPCHSPSERRWFVVRITPVRIAGKAMALVLHENVTLARAPGDDLAQLVDAFKTAPGEDCLESLASDLRRILPADGVVVTEVLRTGEGRVRVLGASGDALPERGAVLALRGAPEAVLTTTRPSIRRPADASASFPEDPRLKVARGFIGAAFGRDERDLPAGMVGAIWKKPIVRTERAERLVSLLAVRAAEELQRRRLQEIARRADALDLAAGETSHELNNLLIAFDAHIGEASEAARDGRDPEAAHDRLRALTRQAGKLAGSLRDLASGPRPSKRVCKLSDIARDGIETIAPLLPPETSVTLDADDNVSVHADSDQLQRALVNLSLNARNAMKQDGGRIVVGVHRSGDKAVLSVTDSGEGLSSRVRDRMFERNFTTRRSEGGSGIGLAVVDDIARAHDGSVSVRSEPGVGTTMAMILPALSSRQSEDQLDERSDRPSERCAVIIEDNPEVLAAVSGMLRSMGYAVVERRNEDFASSPGGALPPETALVVADYGLPGPNGETLIAEMRRAGYRGPAVLMSGSRAHSIGSDAPLRAATLAKPFGETELRSAVGLALDLSESSV